MHRRAFLSAVAGLSILPGLALAQPASLRILHPWVRPTARGQNAAGYLTVSNPGRTPDVLLRVECAAATGVSLHQSRMTGGVMSMQPLAQATVPAGGQLDFAPGGLHIMLEGLRAALLEGQRVPAILVFQRAGRVPVTFLVQAAGPGAAMPMDMRSMPGMSH